ncbi:MAG: TRAP transporter small permease [Thalassobaculum sp.]|uniref:TRAP transporter small permease n=1 Tax=Thalassobaculum sp. TaxID=2022740 RepID=UPI0032EC5386
MLPAFVNQALVLLRRAEMAAAVALLGVIVAVVLAGTVGRYTGHPVVWSDEVAQALFVWLAMLAADLTLQRAGHFRIDFLVRLLPRTAWFLLDLAIKLTIAVLLVALVYYGSLLVRLSDFRPLPMTGVPSSWAVAALPVAYALMIVTVVEQILRHLRGLPDSDAEARDVM